MRTQPSRPRLTPMTQDLVFIGGGHSHAIALRMWGMNPMAGVQLTLITDVAQTPYSGMLPGHIAGFYGFDECHIDLWRLAAFAGARLVVDRAIALDLEQKRVVCAQHPPISFDVLSLDIGSTPNQSGIPGVLDYAIPVKPVPPFLQAWEEFLETIKTQTNKTQTIKKQTNKTQAERTEPVRLGIVGGGAGGVELALTTQARLQKVCLGSGLPPEVHLFHRNHTVMTGYHPNVGRRFTRLLTRYGIHLHLGETVAAIEKKSPELGHANPLQVQCQSGLKVRCDRLFWVTQATAPAWLTASGLRTNEGGFVLVGDSLQSLSHPFVFATGDVATLINHPRPKAGVFAVRQGKPLFENLRRSLQGQPTRPFQPQKRYLALVGTGDGQAVAARDRLCWGPSSLLWWWKDRIDRRFMERFSHLPAMDNLSPSEGDRPKPSPLINHQSIPSSKSPVEPLMRCAGCGAKVGRSLLKSVLDRVQRDQPWVQRDDVLVGLDAPDDGAVLRVPEGQVLVQTVDYFPSLVSDPFVFGQIAAHHCLNDLFAMGATPQSALAIATLPPASQPQMAETLYQLLSGAVQVLHQAGAELVGGHTTEGTELAFGLTCNGLATVDHLWQQGNLQPNQALILTKPLGIGVLFAAHMTLHAKGRWMERAIATMLQSNQKAVSCLRDHRAIACTDVTGFGFLGHLAAMVGKSPVSVELILDNMPILEGALDLTHQGIVSSLYTQNRNAIQGSPQIGKGTEKRTEKEIQTLIENWTQVESHPIFPLLLDPQTSGGLLASVPMEHVRSCVAALQALGYAHTAIIGRTVHPSTANTFQDRKYEIDP